MSDASEATRDALLAQMTADGDGYVDKWVQAEDAAMDARLARMATDDDAFIALADAMAGPIPEPAEFVDTWARGAADGSRSASPSPHRWSRDPTRRVPRVRARAARVPRADAASQSTVQRFRSSIG
jgi:hypothetical protein